MPFPKKNRNGCVAVFFYLSVDGYPIFGKPALLEPMGYGNALSNSSAYEAAQALRTAAAAMQKEGLNLRFWSARRRHSTVQNWRRSDRNMRRCNVHLMMNGAGLYIWKVP
ncbi:hypothetical protein C0557_17120 [Kosakonia sp. MUSA4]|nr:hypothetical protein C0557_17120 [Kosakonia sp. MUSA4]